MTSPRLALAVPLAAATFALVLVTIAMGGALRAGLAPWPGIGMVVMAAAAYVLSRGERSLRVAGLLAAGGLVSLVYGLLETKFLAAATFPGPVFGVILGLLVLGLGLATGLETAQARRR